MFLLLVSLYWVSDGADSTPQNTKGSTWKCISSFKVLFFPLHFRYGFGEAGKPKFGIEPNAELTYEVTLKSFEKVRKANFSKVVVGLFSYPSRRRVLGGLTKWYLFLCLLLFPRDSCPHPATSAHSLGG